MTKTNGRWHEAHWLGPVPNRYEGGALAHKGLILHIQQGYETGTNASFHDPKFEASAHFGVARDGHPDQWVDCDDAAWAEAGGNRYWVSVELEGFTGHPATDAQIETLAKLYAWGHKSYGWKFQLASEPAGEGLGFHAMGGADWGGHYDCPGHLIVSQRQRILDRAFDLVNHHTVTAPPARAKVRKQDTPDWYHRVLRVEKPLLRGSDVAKVQRIVGANEDGLYGHNTEARVRGWQRTHKLDADGVVGPKTAKEMAK